MSATCHSCGAPIVWVHTEAGKRMPIDPEPVDGGNLILDRRDGPRVTVATEGNLPPCGYVSHFATCPQAGKWRKR